MEENPVIVLYKMVKAGDPDSTAYASGRLMQKGLSENIAKYVGTEICKALAAAGEDKAEDVLSDWLNKAYRIEFLNGDFDKITTDEAYPWWRNETGDIMQALHDGGERAIREIPLAKEGKGDKNLTVYYAGTLKGFDKAKASKWRLGVNPAKSEPWELTLDRANKSFREYYSPNVARYGIVLADYWIRNDPAFLVTQEGQEDFGYNIGALGFIADRIFGSEEPDEVPPAVRDSIEYKEAHERCLTIDNAIDALERTFGNIQEAAAGFRQPRK